MTVASTAAGHHTQRVGFIGLGAMGGPIVRHLSSSGWSVVVHDLNAEAVRSAERAGAQVAASPAEVARQTGLVFVCLPSLDALRAVLTGERGVAACGRACTLVDLSTTGPAFAREMRAKLEALDIAYVDAPITGNVTTAGNGKLGVMCSGSEQAYAHAEAVLRTMAGTTVLYLGAASGRAQTLKLLNNLVSATGMAVTSEAFILAAKAGIRPRALLQVFNAGEASTNASRNKFSGSVLRRNFDYGARMAITAKDISFAVAEAEHLDVPVWIARPAQQLWRYAVSQGGADRDGSSLITYLEAWAGVEVRDDDDAHDALLATTDTATLPACHILCEPGHRAGMIARLSALGRDGAEDGAASLVVRTVERDTDLSEICDAVGTPGPGPDRALVINTCWMPAGRVASLAERLGSQGYGFVDAPLSGRTLDSGHMEVSMIVSGNREHVALASPLLHQLGERVYHVSEHPGDAQRVRHLDEAVSAVLLAVACESYVIGARAGLAPATMPQILGIETGRTMASAVLFPQQVLTRKFDSGKRLGRSLRALQLVSDDGAGLQVSAWVLDAARLLYGMAAAELGADADATNLVRLYERWTGVELGSASVDDAREDKTDAQ